MKRLRELYRVNALPVLQNRMFDTPNAAANCARGDMALVQDEDTGLIFNSHFEPSLMQYDTSYQNEQAVSEAFKEHLESVHSVLATSFAATSSLIEVGCGKGYFLELMQRHGFNIVGIDPTYEGSNPAIYKTNYTSDSCIRADGIILRHVLEHVQDPVGFLSRIRDGNNGGKIYIEVPCFDWICEHRAWYDIFYEHVNYFRLEDFGRIFDHIYDAGHTFSGQYLYVVADLTSLRCPVLGPSSHLRFPSEMRVTIERFVKQVGTSASEGRRSAIWGAASKGVIFALVLQQAGATFDLVIDANPAKQGKYLAATGLRVSSPQEALDRLPTSSDIFVMNGNYLNEIESLTQNRFNLTAIDHLPIDRASR